MHYLGGHRYHEQDPLTQTTLHREVHPEQDASSQTIHHLESLLEQDLSTQTPADRRWAEFDASSERNYQCQAVANPSAGLDPSRHVESAM